MKDLKKTPISIPINLENQNKISGLLSKIDKLIFLSKKQKEQYILFKKSLLQKMFI